MNNAWETSNFAIQKYSQIHNLKKNVYVLLLDFVILFFK